MLDTLRLAATALQQTLDGRNLNEVLLALHARHPQLTGQQRAAIQDLSFGALRHYGRYCALLDLLIAKPLSDEGVRCLLLAALHQLQDHRAAPHAVVDNAVKAALAMKKPWAKGLVNAVLRNFLRRREDLLGESAARNEVARHSHPQWWIDQLRRLYPAEWQDILTADNVHPPLTLRVNQRRTTPTDYLAALQQAGLTARQVGPLALRLDHPVPVARLPGFADGLVSVQDGGAQWAAPLLDVQDGMRVLDACAAPGGKTAHLLELANLDLVALDNDAGRLAKVRDNLVRLGLDAHCVAGDAGDPSAWWDGRPFQRILADVPCSASGVVRRHPDIKWLRRPDDLAGFAAQQAQILDALWRLLAAGGKLLYVTCSLFAEENRNQIKAFLAGHEDAAEIPLTFDDARDGQLLPNEIHDGFFYALLQKR